jgi:hypothetical protein
MTDQPRASKARHSTVALALVSAGALIAGGILGQASTGTTTTAAPAATVTVTTTTTAPAPAPVTVTAAPTTAPAKPTPAAVIIPAGVVLIPEDVPPGRYRMKDPVSGDSCYWGIYRAGTNQDDIIANNNVRGGRAIVTLRKGQEFESDCGDWVKVG